MRRSAFVVPTFLAVARLAFGGPPFVTDDPVPVDFQHWEVYLASQYFHSPDGATGTLPQIEVNYGAAPNLQLHLIAPVGFNSPSNGGNQTGFADTELGAKYRFVGGGQDPLQAALFPLVELPTGDRAHGLGSGHVQAFLPVWLQKTYGSWTTYGGGGYWINPGAKSRNWIFTGLLIQRQILPNLAVGAELYHETAKERAAGSDTIVDIGVIWDLSDLSHVLASAGPTIQGPSGYQAYVALQLTFGPSM